MRYYTDTNLNSVLSLKLTDRRVLQAIPPQPHFHQQELRTRGGTLYSTTGSLGFWTGVSGLTLWRLRLQPAFDFSWCSPSFTSWMKTPDSNKGEHRRSSNREAGLVIPDLPAEPDVHWCHSWKYTAGKQEMAKTPKHILHKLTCMIPVV